MKLKYLKSKYLLVALTSWFVFGQGVYADAPLKNKLNLSIEQAKQVSDIRSSHRRPFSAKRQEFNRESRALRRARSSNDSEQIAALEPKIEALRMELVKIRATEDDEIRAVLTAKQKTSFEQYIEERQAMVGSSRDAKLTQ